MLEVATTDNDNLYWEIDSVLALPKQKRAQLEDELLNDLVSTVKMAAMQKKKTPKSTLKASPLALMTATTNVHGKLMDATTVASQNSAISQLMEQVSQIKMENKY